MKDSILALGLMSGTSMDGIDAVLVRIQEDKDETIFHLQKDYSKKTAKLLKKIVEKSQVSLLEFGELDYLLGEEFAATANSCLQAVAKKHSIQRNDIDLICSHGQTIFHAPKNHTSIQLGSGQVIAHKTGITTVYNFRLGDIVSGGEGAPLLPYYHQRFLKNKQKKIAGRAIHNLGGISNFTYFIDENRLFSLDTGPANCWMDSAIEILSKNKFHFDSNGQWATKGTLNKTLLTGLKKDPAIKKFLQKPAPKSTGRELFNSKRLEFFLKKAKKSHLTPYDILASLNQFSADLIIEAYERFVRKKGLPLEEIIFCGGGSKNKNLLERIAQGLPNTQISVLENYNLNSQVIEAQAFACYGLMALLAKPQSIPSATGAKIPSLGGQIIPGTNWKHLYQKIYNFQWNRF